MFSSRRVVARSAMKRLRVAREWLSEEKGSVLSRRG